MTIRVGDKTVYLMENYNGTNLSVLASKCDAGEIQVLATFVPPSSRPKEQGTIRLMKNYHFEFANAAGQTLLSLFDRAETAL